MSGTPIVAIIEAVETRLSDAELGLRLIDRIGALAKCTPGQLLDKGVLVAADTSTNTGQYRDQELARLRTTLRVEFAHRVVPGKQKDSRGRAIELEERLRCLLTFGAYDAAFHLTYAGSRRGLHPIDGAWWVATLNFTAEHDAVVGG